MRLHENAADFLPNPEFFIFNFTLLTSTLNYLKPYNSIIVLGTRRINISQELEFRKDFQNLNIDMKIERETSLPLPKLKFLEPHYSTPFTIYEIPFALLLQWTHPYIRDDLYLPHPNPYVIDDRNFDLCYPENYYPIIIKTSPLIKMWMLTSLDRGYFEKMTCKLFGKVVANSLQSQGNFSVCFD